MHDRFGDAYMRAWDAALSAAVESVRQLPDDEIARLARYSGIVGLAAEHVKAARSRHDPTTE